MNRDLTCLLWEWSFIWFSSFLKVLYVSLYMDDSVFVKGPVTINFSLFQVWSPIYGKTGSPLAAMRIPGTGLSGRLLSRKSAPCLCSWWWCTELATVSERTNDLAEASLREKICFYSGFSLKEKRKAVNCSDMNNRQIYIGHKNAVRLEMRKFPSLRAVNFWNSLLTEWIGETQPMKTKASHRLFEVNCVKTTTGIGACESQGWIWRPERSFQACFPWKQYLRPRVPSLMLEKSLCSYHRIAWCWVPRGLRWAIGWKLLVPVCQCVTLAEMQHWNISPNSGQLVKKKRAVYCWFDLCQLFSSWLIMVWVPPYCFMFMGYCGEKFVFS